MNLTARKLLLDKVPWIPQNFSPGQEQPGVAPDGAMEGKPEASIIPLFGADVRIFPGKEGSENIFGSDFGVVALAGVVFEDAAHAVEQADVSDLGDDKVVDQKHIKVVQIMFERTGGFHIRH